MHPLHLRSGLCHPLRRSGLCHLSPPYHPGQHLQKGSLLYLFLLLVRNFRMNFWSLHHLPLRSHKAPIQSRRKHRIVRLCRPLGRHTLGLFLASTDEWSHRHRWKKKVRKSIQRAIEEEEDARGDSISLQGKLRKEKDDQDDPMRCAWPWLALYSLSFHL